MAESNSNNDDHRPQPPRRQLNGDKENAVNRAGDKPSALLDAPLKSGRGSDQRSSNNASRHGGGGRRSGGSGNDRSRDYHGGGPPPHDRSNNKPKTKLPDYHVTNQEPDARLGDINDDPRGCDPTKRITKKASSRGNGRNTESFDPASTLVRPDLRIHVGSSRSSTFNRPLKHDDVVIVPELFGAEDDWSLYYKLVDEMRKIQSKGQSKGSEWISWHEGAHLISKNPTDSPTFNMIIDRLCEYFKIRKQSIGTRFNWYRDSSDWKPFHHDSAAFNPQRARNQNITVGVSFGSMRELAFIHATEKVDGEKCRVYFPQPNNGVFSFGRDANILWKHGVNALAPDQQDGKGRISIILWGLAQDAIEEEGSPPLLGSDGKGPHAGGGGRGGGRNRGRDRRRGGGGGRGGRGDGGVGDVGVRR
mmetsp:Transcript_29292/g.63571  ORF Transcript_29292/g.63571 Transcript_29292/m.63571 type:complete len:418 (-) Transcript_29292:76-1329(-)